MKVSVVTNGQAKILQKSQRVCYYYRGLLYPKDSLTQVFVMLVSSITGTMEQRTLLRSNKSQ
jgi:hypothetical protein